jgi:hypothetical protein
MSIVRVHNFGVSLDGFSTGEGQSLEQPFGHAGTRLLDGFMGTRTFQNMHGEPGGSTGADEAFASNWAPGIGAEIMGRNKFGPQRGPWADEEWKGWWGDDPVFHTPVFVLTHHPRPTIEMKGGTTFHFIDASPVEALRIARRGSHRPHAHCDRADCPRARRTAVGGSRRSGRPLFHRGGKYPQRHHAHDVLSPVARWWGPTRRAQHR